MSRRLLRTDRRRALYASTAWFIGPLLPMKSAFARVLIEDADPGVAELSERLVRNCGTARERAVVLHDYVRDGVRFGFTPQMYAMTAGNVLHSGLGYSSTKSTLFVALLRAAGIEARQQFVDIDRAVLGGLIDLRTPFVDHCYTEVLLGGAWVPTDSYVVDSALVRASTAALRAEGRNLGYGVRVDGRSEWDGRRPAFVQYIPGEHGHTRNRWGVFSDVADFYDRTPGAWNRMTNVTRVILPLTVHTANRTAESLRRHGPSAVRGRCRTLEA